MESLEEFVAVPTGKPSRCVASIQEADRLLVVDVSNMAYRGGFAYNLNTSKGVFSGHVFGAFKILMYVMERIPAMKWYPVFCYDGINSKAVRQQIDPNYKANRDPTRFDPKPDVYIAFQSIPGLHIDHPDLEADDAIAWVCRGLKKPVSILSSDKDFWSLISDTTDVWSPHFDRYVNTADILKAFCVQDPKKIPMSKALFGDASDDIKGVHRLMKAQVTSALNSTDSVDEFIAAVLESGATAKTKLKVQESRDIILRNLELIKPRPGIKREHTRIQKIDAEALLQVLTSWECFSIIDKSDMLLGKTWFADE
jgi:5'-3' exonuclease